MLRRLGTVEPWLLEAVRRLPGVAEGSPVTIDALLASADRHGLAGVLLDAHVARGVAIPTRHLERDIARASDHAAHLDVLARIDAVLHERAVVLKGALLAERLYPRPSARPTSDIDLLVAPASMDAAIEALRGVGYEASTDPSEEHFRRLGHHLHLFHAQAPSLELHFHAYRGFGTLLPAAPLVERSLALPAYTHLRVLAPDDELHYLAVHAAAHRFIRLGWLYDLLLLGRTLDAVTFARAFERAQETRTTRPLALALTRLEALLGSPAPASDDRLHLRRRLLAAVTGEPAWPPARAATRFAYSLALCEDWSTARGYVREAFEGRFGASSHR